MRALFLFILFAALPGWATTAVPSYKYFKSDRAAADYYDEHLEEQMAAFGKRSRRTLLPPNDENAVRVRAIVARVFKEFKALYPRKLSHLTQPPRALVLNDSTMNAFAVNPFEGTIPYIFVVHLGLVQSAPNESVIYGVIAHELTHLLLLHGHAEIAEGLRKFSLVNGDEDDALSVLRPRDPSLQNDMQLWLFHAKDAGPLARPELNGLPVPGNSILDMRSMLKYFMSRDLVTADCIKRAGFGYRAVERLYIDRLDTYNGRYVMDNEQWEKIGQESASAVAALKECAVDSQGRPIKTTYYKTWEILSRLEIKNLLPLMSEFEAQEARKDAVVFDAQPNELASVIALTLRKQEILRAVEAKHDLTRVRYYSVENEADGMAVQILLRMGLKAEDYAAGFYRFLGPMANTCYLTIKAGQVPPYGALFDEHHGTCYRVHDILKLSTYLKAHPGITRPLSEIAQQAR